MEQINERTLGEDVWARLAAPFAPSEVHVRALQVNKDRTRGLLAVYIDARSVLDRLDEVVGPENWHDEYEILAEGVVMCRLTVLGITKTDVGEGDTPKAAFSDAIKRAGVRHGIARSLYSVPSIWGPIDDRGNVKDPETVKRALLGIGPKPVPKPTRPANRRPLRSSDELIEHEDQLPF